MTTRWIIREKRGSTETPHIELGLFFCPSFSPRRSEGARLPTETDQEGNET